MQTSTSSLSRSIVLGSKLSSTLARSLGRVVLKARMAGLAIGETAAALHRRRGEAANDLEEYEVLHALLGAFDRIDGALRRARIRSGAEVDMFSQSSEAGVVKGYLLVTVF